MRTTVARKPSQVTKASSRRSDRFAALEYVRANTSRAGGKSCLFANKHSSHVHAGATSTGVVHLANVQRCASPWSCPICAPTIGERRAQEIDRFSALWRRAGNRIYFVTATLSHQHGDDLDELLERVQSAWSRTWRWSSPHYSKESGNLTNADRVRPTWYAGQTRSVEITYGDFNGWHPHVHAAIYVPKKSRGTLKTIQNMKHRWAESVERIGGTCDVTSSKSPGWNVKHVRDAAGMAKYLTKIEGGWGLGLEIAGAAKKGKGVTPFMLLARALAGDNHAAVLWDIYERATRGRRRVVASPGLLKLVDDKEAAVAEVEGAFVCELYVKRSDWKRLMVAGKAAGLLGDLASLAAGESTSSSWCWPARWLLVHPPPAVAA